MDFIRYNLLLLVLLPSLLWANSNALDNNNLAANTALSDISSYPPTPQLIWHGIDLSGYVAGSYNYLSNSPDFISGINDRSFDIEPNGFTLQQAGLLLTKLPTKGLGGALNLLSGQDVSKVAAYGLAPLFDSHNFSVDLTQAYLQYAQAPVTILLGKFESLAGYESTFSPQTVNFSQSLVGNYAEPTTHVGVRTTYLLSDEQNIAVGINDGWDTIRDWSRRKTLELGTAHTSKHYTWSAYIYNGQERTQSNVSDGPTGIRTLVNCFGTVDITDKLTLAANYDYLTQNRAYQLDGDLGRVTLQGLALYANYQINDWWRSAVRGEVFNDRDGYTTGVKQTLTELTATIGYLVMKHAEIRFETRHDRSNVNAYLTKNGHATSQNLQSFAVEGIITF